MFFSKPITEIIKERTSRRTYSPKPIEQDKKDLYDKLLDKFVRLKVQIDNMQKQRAEEKLILEKKREEKAEKEKKKEPEIKKPKLKIEPVIKYKMAKNPVYREGLWCPPKPNQGEKFPTKD